jgi:putative ABC transport system substrate-binding protein
LGAFRKTWGHPTNGWGMDWGDRMKRREFITLLGGAAAAWPLAARAQQTLPTTEFSSPTTTSAESQGVAAFVQRLRAVGWIEGRAVALKVRWAEARRERAAEIVAEFVRQKADVIVCRGTASVLAAKRATSVIPIVFAGGDPVGTGLVVSLARAGGNVTGLSLQQSDLAGKRLELLRDVVPALRRLAILANAGNPVTLRDMREVEVAAPGLMVATVEIWRVEDIAAGFEALKVRADMFRA